MRHSETLGALAKALAAAQAEIENAHKNASNPHFRSSYADLAEIINTARPVLTKHGLSVVQLPGYADGRVTVETILLHESGEWLSGVAEAPAQKQDPQGVGSALTYLRRYSLAAVCCMAQEDDDGNAAVQPRREDRERGNGGRSRTTPTTSPTTPTGSGGGSWDRVMPFGRGKGKKLGELSVEALEATITWCQEKDAEKFADLIQACADTIDHKIEMGAPA